MVQDQVQPGLDELKQQYLFGEFDLCLATAEQLLSAAESSGDQKLKAETLFIKGCTQASCRKYHESDLCLNTAAELFDTLGLQNEQVRCQIRQAKSSVLMHEFERGRKLLNSVGESYVKGEEPLLDAEYVVVEGLLSTLGEGDYESGIRCYTEACELFHSINEHLSAYTHKKNLAAFHSALKEYDKAEQLLGESISKLMGMGATRHVLDIRINLALLAARRYQFSHARNLSYDCMEHAKTGFEPAVMYRILYNLSLIETALENFTDARKHILRLVDIPDINLTSSQLGALQTMLAAVELVLEGPQTGAEILMTARHNLPSYTPSLDWTYLMLDALCKLGKGDIAAAKAGFEAAMEKRTGPDLEVYSRIVHSCTGRLIKGRPGKYEQLAPAESEIASRIQDELVAFTPEIFAALSRKSAF